MDESELLLGKVRIYLAKIYLRERLSKPPDFDDGSPQLSLEEWYRFLYSFVRNPRGLSYLVGISIRDANKIRDSYYREIKRRKAGKTVGERNTNAEMRREFVSNNINKSAEWIAEGIGVTLSTAKTMLSKARKKKLNGHYTSGTYVALAEAYCRVFPDIRDDGLAENMGCNRVTAGHYRRRAGIYLRRNKRRSKMRSSD